MPLLNLHSVGREYFTLSYPEYVEYPKPPDKVFNVAVFTSPCQKYGSKISFFKFMSSFMNFR